MSLLHDVLQACLAQGGGGVVGNVRVPASVCASDELHGLAADPDADGLLRVDLAIGAGRIQRVAPAGALQPDAAAGLQGRQLWPAFADIHTHLDKAHTWARAPLAQPTLLGAVKALMADKPQWHEAELRLRVGFALRSALAHGTSSLRTHVDALGPQAAMSWGVLQNMAHEWRGRIRMQCVAMAPLEFYLSDAAPALADRVAGSGGLLGAVTLIAGKPPAEAAQLVPLAMDRLFTLARERGLALDLHVDESADPAAASLVHVAQATLRHDLQGRVLCGHCCSLSAQQPAAMAAMLDLCRDAQLAVVSLPLVNSYLQDRVTGLTGMTGVTPRWRGVAPLHEAAARGIPVALASDNCGDAFHPYGDHDPLEVLREAARTAHLGPQLAPWVAAVTATPGGLMGFAGEHRIQPGAPADFTAFNARSMAELLARPQADRCVVRQGTIAHAELPGFEELDVLHT